MNNTLNGLYNGSKHGFKITDLVLRKLDHWRNEALYPLIRRYWPQSITPNHLTSIRIGVALLIGWAIIIDVYLIDFQILNIIIPLYIIGILSDLLDGAVARCLNKTSRTGAFLDPLADKALNLTIAVYLLAANYHLLLTVIITAEIISSIGAIICFSYNQKIESNIFGKVKMFTQSAIYLYVLIFSLNNWLIGILWITALFSVVSLAIKFWEFSTQKEYGT